jgi:hypothetical protein
MAPKDLKNPDGLKGTQNEEANAAASNEEKKEKNVTPDAENQEQEVNPEKQVVLDEKIESSKQEQPDAPDPDDEAPVTHEEDGPVDKSDEEADPVQEVEVSQEEDTASDDPDKEEADTTAGDDESETEKSEPAGEDDIQESEPEVTSETSLQDPENPEIVEEPVAEEEPAVPSEEKAEDEQAAPTAREEAKEEETEEDQETEVKEDNSSSPIEEPVSAPSAEKVYSSDQKEKKVVHEPSKKEKPDFSTYSEIELVNAMSEVLERNNEYDIKDDVEAIKAAFYRKVKEDVEEQKKKFIEEGGFEEEFQEQESPYEQDIRELLKKYRQIRHEFNKKLEHDKEQNLQLKYEIIEEIKGLLHKEESINKTFQEFRELQQRWREIGPVPQTKMKDLWDTYHFHVESFYDYIKINQELRDLDLKKNLEVKIKLCEQAEELLLESNTVKAFNQLQKLHDRWREAGPVPRENKDDIWDRFKAATAKINKKHQDYFENRKSEQKKNLEAKKALCEQIEEINEMEIDNHKDWGEKSKEVVNLQRIWRTIGFAPRKDNNKIYTRFREACDKFFDAKRDFYSKNKEVQQTNLQMKLDLCIQAEALKDSTDWRKATQDLINIQKQWKEIGPVPRKHSDILWKRFRQACDYFFDKKSEHFSSIDTEQVDNLKAKEQLIHEVENFKSTGDVNKNFELLKDFQRRWTEIGHVPMKKKEEVQRRFRNAINKLFDDLNMDDSNRNMLKFRTKMVTFSESSRGQNKMRLERDKYMTKLKQLEGDLVLLDNNIGFFAKSKNAEALIEDVRQKIEQTKEKIEYLKNKIRVIDEMDSSEE